MEERREVLSSSGWMTNVGRGRNAWRASEVLMDFLIRPFTCARMGDSIQIAKGKAYSWRNGGH